MTDNARFAMLAEVVRQSNKALSSLVLTATFLLLFVLTLISAQSVSCHIVCVIALFASSILWHHYADRRDELVATLGGQKSVNELGRSPG